MPYIGHNPTQAGSFILLDDFDSEFDGSDVTFTLQIGGVDITPTADNLLIILDGVVQHSPEAYTVSGSTLTFTAAPASGQEFYGMLMGQSASVGQGTVGADELSVSGDGSANQLLSSDADGTMTWKDGSLSTTSATGDLIYRNNSGVLERLAVGSAGQVLTVASGVPAWETDVESYLPLSGGTMTGALNMNSQNITNGGAIAGTFTGGLTGNVSGNLTGNVTGNTSGTAATVTGAAQSNITSVGTLTSLTTGTVTVDVNQTSAGLVIDNDTAGKGGIHFKDGGASKGMVGLTGVITGDSSEDMGMFSEHGSGIGLFVNGSGTRVVDINSSGNTTFSGGVAINSGSANKITHNHGSTALEIENQGSKRALYVHSNVDGGQDNPLVEIKADNPAFDQEVLRIHNDGANHSIQVLDDGSEVFSIASGGNVGIGHTTPEYGLTLAQGTSDSGKIGWEDAGNNKRGAIFVSSSNDRMEFMTGTSDTVRMSIFSDGLVNINTTSQWNLQCQREDGSSQGMILFTNGSSNVGSITTTQAATYFNTSSDYRLKENEVAISDGITRLKQLKPYRFNFKVTPDTIVDGFFAHEVSSIVPEAIFGVKDAVDENGDIEAQGIDQSKLVPLLVSALQEAIDRIEALENA